MTSDSTVIGANIPAQAVSLDVWADIACPWCFLGHRTLQGLLDSSKSGPVQRRHRAFLLRSDMPSGGIPYDELMRQIFGSREAALPSEERLSALGHDIGIDFDFAAMPVAANSRLAHLAVLASPPEAQTHVLDALYAAYWEHGRDITDPDEVLRAATAASGGDQQQLRSAMAQAAAALDRDLAEAQELRITAVPTLIANDRVAVQGAQPVAALEKLLELARQ